MKAPIRVRRLVALPLVIATVLPALHPPAASAALGGGNGVNFDCPPGPPTVIAQFHDPQELVGGAGGVSCPPPGANAPGHFGAGSVSSGPAPQPQPGTPCEYEYDTPAQFRLNGSTPQIQIMFPGPPAGPYTSDPAAPSWQPNAWSSVDANWTGLAGQAGISDLYQEAGAMDFFWPWFFFGTWTQNGGQVVCTRTAQDRGWRDGCPPADVALSACLTSAPPAVPPASQGLAVGALGVDLNALLRGQFSGGNITSLPARPNPGLTNVPTCFSIGGMTVNGQPADPQREVDWERIVEGPDVGEGRHVYFVFIIRIRYEQTVWDFGDGTTVTIPQGGSSPETPPQQCGPLPNEQFLLAHTYHAYSTGDGFHVTATHQYGVSVTELWRDSDPNPHRLDFPDVIPPVAVLADPLPAYVMPIVQEEGVPIG